jgi:hypothetical protein
MMGNDVYNKIEHLKQEIASSGFALLAMTSNPQLANPE